MDEYLRKETLVEMIKTHAADLWSEQNLYTDQSARAFEGLAEKITKMPAEKVAPIRDCDKCKFVYRDEYGPCNQCRHHYEDKFEEHP